MPCGVSEYLVSFHAAPGAALTIVWSTVDQEEDRKQKSLQVLTLACDGMFPFKGRESGLESSVSLVPSHQRLQYKPVMLKSTALLLNTALHLAKKYHETLPVAF